MFTEQEANNDSIVIYQHRFDRITKLHAGCAPVCVCHEEDLVQVLDKLVSKMPNDYNYLLETVSSAELSAAELLDIAGHLLRTHATLPSETLWGVLEG